MRYFGRADRDRWALAAALLVPPAVAAVFIPWRSSLAHTDVALLLVVVIVAIAANGHRVAGILTAASAAVWFDFFWAAPYERFTISRASDIATTLLLLATGVAVSELAARGRHARRTVAFDTAYLAGLRSTTQLVTDGRDPRDVVEHVRAQLIPLLGLRDARFERTRLMGHPPELTDDGALQWGKTRWDIDEYGFPDEEIGLWVRSGGRTFGRFMLTPVPGTRPSSAARQVATMLAALVGTAIARQVRASSMPAA